VDDADLVVMVGAASGAERTYRDPDRQNHHQRIRLSVINVTST
jgi:hypothetical protein